MLEFEAGFWDFSNEKKFKNDEIAFIIPKVKSGSIAILNQTTFPLDGSLSALPSIAAASAVFYLAKSR